MENEENKYILQSVNNALSILQLLCKYDELSVTEVAQHMHLGKSTAFRLLATLEARNFVDKSENSKYRLGIKLSSIGGIVLNRMEIIRVAHPFLVKMTEQSAETSHLVILCNDTEAEFVDKVASPYSIRTDSKIGFCRDAHLMATGKVLLANQSREFIDNYIKNVQFKARTPFSIASPQTLLEALESIREHGYGCDINESEMGLTCIAAPIMDMVPNVIAAISISGPSDRMNAKRDQFIHLVMETARSISDLISK